MYIVATFHGDDTFSHLLDTNKLEESLKEEVENKIKKNICATFDGDYFKSLQKAVVLPKDILPISIHAMIDVYLE